MRSLPVNSASKRPYNIQTNTRNYNSDRDFKNNYDRNPNTHFASSNTSGRISIDQRRYNRRSDRQSRETFVPNRSQSPIFDNSRNLNMYPESSYRSPSQENSNQYLNKPIRFSGANKTNNNPNYRASNIKRNREFMEPNASFMPGYRETRANNPLNETIASSPFALPVGQSPRARLWPYKSENSSQGSTNESFHHKSHKVESIPPSPRCIMDGYDTIVHDINETNAYGRTVEGSDMMGYSGYSTTARPDSSENTQSAQNMYCPNEYNMVRDYRTFYANPNQQCDIEGRMIGTGQESNLPQDYKLIPISFSASPSLNFEHSNKVKEDCLLSQIGTSDNESEFRKRAYGYETPKQYQTPQSAPRVPTRQKRKYTKREPRLNTGQNKRKAMKLKKIIKSVVDERLKKVHEEMFSNWDDETMKKCSRTAEEINERTQSDAKKSVSRMMPFYNDSDASTDNRYNIDMELHAYMNDIDIDNELEHVDSMGTKETKPVENSQKLQSNEMKCAYDRGNLELKQEMSDILPKKNLVATRNDCDSREMDLVKPVLRLPQNKMFETSNPDLNLSMKSNTTNLSEQTQSEAENLKTKATSSKEKSLNIPILRGNRISRLRNIFSNIKNATEMQPFRAESRISKRKQKIVGKLEDTSEEVIVSTTREIDEENLPDDLEGKFKLLTFDRMLDIVGVEKKTVMDTDSELPGKNEEVKLENKCEERAIDSEQAKEIETETSETVKSNDQIECDMKTNECDKKTIECDAKTIEYDKKTITDNDDVYLSSQDLFTQSDSFHTCQSNTQDTESHGVIERKTEERIDETIEPIVAKEIAENLNFKEIDGNTDEKVRLLNEEIEIRSCDTDIEVVDLVSLDSEQKQGDDDVKIKEEMPGDVQTVTDKKNFIHEWINTNLHFKQEPHEEPSDIEEKFALDEKFDLKSKLFNFGKLPNVKKEFVKKEESELFFEENSLMKSPNSSDNSFSSFSVSRADTFYILSQKNAMSEILSLSDSSMLLGNEPVNKNVDMKNSNTKIFESEDKSSVVLKNEIITKKDCESLDCNNGEIKECNEKMKSLPPSENSEALREDLPEKGASGVSDHEICGTLCQHSSERNEKMKSSSPSENLKTLREDLPKKDANGASDHEICRTFCQHSSERNEKMKSPSPFENLELVRENLPKKYFTKKYVNNVSEHEICEIFCQHSFKLYSDLTECLRKNRVSKWDEQRTTTTSSCVDSNEIVYQETLGKLTYLEDAATETASLRKVGVTGRSYNFKDTTARKICDIFMSDGTLSEMSQTDASQDLFSDVSDKLQYETGWPSSQSEDAIIFSLASTQNHSQQSKEIELISSIDPSAASESSREVCAFSWMKSDTEPKNKTEIQSVSPLNIDMTFKPNVGRLSPLEIVTELRTPRKSHRPPIQTNAALSARQKELKSITDSKFVAEKTTDYVQSTGPRRESVPNELIPSTHFLFRNEKARAEDAAETIGGSKKVFNPFFKRSVLLKKHSQQCTTEHIKKQIVDNSTTNSPNRFETKQNEPRRKSKRFADDPDVEFVCEITRNNKRLYNLRDRSVRSKPAYTSVPDVKFNDDVEIVWEKLTCESKRNRENKMYGLRTYRSLDNVNKTRYRLQSDETKETIYNLRSRSRDKTKGANKTNLRRPYHSMDNVKGTEPLRSRSMQNLLAREGIDVENILPIENEELFTASKTTRRSLRLWSLEKKPNKKKNVDENIRNKPIEKPRNKSRTSCDGKETDDSETVSVGRNKPIEKPRNKSRTSCDGKETDDSETVSVGRKNKRKSRGESNSPRSPIMNKKRNSQEITKASNLCVEPRTARKRRSPIKNDEFESFSVKQFAESNCKILTGELRSSNKKQGTADSSPEALQSNESFESVSENKRVSEKFVSKRNYNDKNVIKRTLRSLTSDEKSKKICSETAPIKRSDESPSSAKRKLRKRAMPVENVLVDNRPQRSKKSGEKKIIHFEKCTVTKTDGRSVKKPKNETGAHEMKGPNSKNNSEQANDLNVRSNLTVQYSKDVNGTNSEKINGDALLNRVIDRRGRKPKNNFEEASDPGINDTNFSDSNLIDEDMEDLNQGSAFLDGCNELINLESRRTKVFKPYKLERRNYKLDLRHNRKKIDKGESDSSNKMRSQRFKKHNERNLKTREGLRQRFNILFPGLKFKSCVKNKLTRFNYKPNINTDSKLIFHSIVKTRFHPDNRLCVPKKRALNKRNALKLSKIKIDTEAFERPDQSTLSTDEGSTKQNSSASRVTRSTQSFEKLTIDDCVEMSASIGTKPAKCKTAEKRNVGMASIQDPNINEGTPRSRKNESDLIELCHYLTQPNSNLKPADTNFVTFTAFTDTDSCPTSSDEDLKREKVIATLKLRERKPAHQISPESLRLSKVQLGKNKPKTKKVTPRTKMQDAVNFFANMGYVTSENLLLIISENKLNENAVPASSSVQVLTENSTPDGKMIGLYPLITNAMNETEVVENTSVANEVVETEVKCDTTENQTGNDEETLIKRKENNDSQSWEDLNQESSSKGVIKKCKTGSKTQLCSSATMRSSSKIKRGKQLVSRSKKSLQYDDQNFPIDYIDDLNNPPPCSSRVTPTKQKKLKQLNKPLVESSDSEDENYTKRLFSQLEPKLSQKERDESIALEEFYMRRKDINEPGTSTAFDESAGTSKEGAGADEFLSELKQSHITESMIANAGELLGLEINDSARSILNETVEKCKQELGEHRWINPKFSDSEEREIKVTDNCLYFEEGATNSEEMIQGILPPYIQDNWVDDNSPKLTDTAGTLNFERFVENEDLEFDEQLMAALAESTRLETTEQLENREMICSEIQTSDPKVVRSRVQASESSRQTDATVSERTDTGDSFSEFSQASAAGTDLSEAATVESSDTALQSIQNNNEISEQEMDVDVVRAESNNSSINFSGTDLDEIGLNQLVNDFDAVTVNEISVSYIESLADLDFDKKLCLTENISPEELNINAEPASIGKNELRIALPEKSESEKRKDMFIAREKLVAEVREKGFPDFSGFGMCAKCHSKNDTTDSESSSSDDHTDYSLDSLDLFTPKEDKLDRILVARIPSGDYVGIRIFVDQPTEFENDYARQMFYISSARNAMRFRHSLQTGELDPELFKDRLIFDIKLTLEDELRVGEEYILERKRERLAWLKIESKLVQADSDIKSHLGLEKAEPEKALATLENILTLSVEPLMLIKHPHILDMAKRLRRYIGNSKEWSMTESELSDFHIAAANIRDVANSVYQKFKNIFDTPPDKLFIDYFDALRKEYQDATKDLSETQKFSICSKPGSKQYFLDIKDAEEEIRLLKLKEMIKKDKRTDATADAADSPELNQDFPMDEKENY